jgi:hypothetical protein
MSLSGFVLFPQKNLDFREAIQSLFCPKCYPDLSLDKVVVFASLPQDSKFVKYMLQVYCMMPLSFFLQWMHQFHCHHRHHALSYLPH